MAAKSSSKPTRPTPTALGDQVIALRTEGKSFAAIAKAVGVERKLDAFRLFVDAIASRSPAEQKKLRAAENKRLDALELRTRDNVDVDARDKALASIVKLRSQISG